MRLARAGHTQDVRDRLWQTSAFTCEPIQSWSMDIRITREAECLRSPLVSHDEEHIGFLAASYLVPGQRRKDG